MKFMDRLEQNLITVQPKRRAAVKAAFLTAYKAIGKEIDASAGGSALAGRVRTWLQERLADIAVQLAPELQTRKSKVTADDPQN